MDEALIVRRLNLVAGAEFEPGALDPALERDLRACGREAAPGPAVDRLLAQRDVGADVEAVRDCLRGFRAWHELELLDDDANVRRVLWLIGRALVDDDVFVIE